MRKIDNRQKQQAQLRAARVHHAGLKAHLEHPHREESPRQTAGEAEGSHHGEVVSAEVLQHRSANKAGRNDPCPCGSGKKYKKCCLNKQEQ